MSTPPATTGARTAATLFESTDKCVTFDFNPQSITISHTPTRQEVPVAKKGDSNAAGGSGGGTTLVNQGQVKDTGPTTIDLGKVILVDGPKTVVDTCKLLLGWSYPITKDANAAWLTKLTFKWGSISYPVTMQSVTISYERFDSTGKPVRATATIKLHYEGDTPPGTNPTSGGIPGRRSHTLVAGENLQHLATANYGKPGAWRALAAANGIENPLAVQPGTVIYLPAPAELADGGPR